MGKKYRGGFRLLKKKDKQGRRYFVDRKTGRRVSYFDFWKYWKPITPKLRKADAEKLRREGRYLPQKETRVLKKYLKTKGLETAKQINEYIKTLDSNNWKKILFSIRGDRGRWRNTKDIGKFVALFAGLGVKFFIEEKKVTADVFLAYLYELDEKSRQYYYDNDGKETFDRDYYWTNFLLQETMDQQNIIFDNIFKPVPDIKNKLGDWTLDDLN